MSIRVLMVLLLLCALMACLAAPTWAGTIAGAVKTSGGVGIADAIVGIKTSPKATADADTYLVTDASGNYTSGDLTPGTYYVAAWKTDGSYYPSADQVVNVSDSPTTVPSISLTANTGANLIYNRADLVTANYFTDYWGTAAKAVDTDGLGSCWYVSPNDVTDPVYFYVDLGATADIRDVVWYRENGWGKINYEIDAMTTGNPLTPGDWDIPGNSSNVYAASDTVRGYVLPVGARIVNAIHLPLNGIKGLRIKMTRAADTWLYNIYDLQVHTNPAPTLSGRVVNGSGSGVANAIVGLKTRPKATADAQTYLTTDANGNYTSGPVLPGTYYVAAWKTDGSCYPSADQVVNASGGPATVPNITLAANISDNIIYNRADLVAASHFVDYWGPAGKANDVDPALDTTWHCLYSDVTDPVYFYVDLGGTDDIKDVVFYRESRWGTVNYEIDAMTAGKPLTPGDWDVPGNSYNAYSATAALGGYTVASPANRCVNAINLPLNGIKGLRFKFTRTTSTYYYNLFDLQVHSATKLRGTVKGVVKDATTGTPIYNAAVQLGGFGGAAVITDATGAYSLSASVGTLELYGDASGYEAKYEDVTLSSDGIPLVKDILLTAKSESIYNGSFETPGGGPTLADGWEINVGGAPTSNYVGTRSTAHNSTPGGSACGWIHTGAPFDPPLPDGWGNFVYWYDGWLRPTAAHRIPVSPYSKYNFYYKMMDGDTDHQSYLWYNHLYWYAEDGEWLGELKFSASDPKKNEWTQVFNSAFPELGWALHPTLQVTPPAGAAYLEVNLGLRMGWDSSQTRVDEVFFDDVVVDEIPGEAPQTNKIAEIKALEDGANVLLTEKIVTTDPDFGGVPDQVLYIEESDRSSGIRVASSEFVLPGDMVSVLGTIATTPSGERYINAAQVLYTLGTPLKPLGANTRALAEKLMEGLLVRVTGKVKSLGSDFYTISDGYTKDGVEVETKVIFGTMALPSVGEFVTVTGVASRDETGRVILTVPWPPIL